MGTALGGGKPNEQWEEEGLCVSKEFINSVRCKNVMNRKVMKSNS